MVSLFVTVSDRISCFYVLIPKHFTDPQAIVYVRFQIRHWCQTQVANEVAGLGMRKARRP